MIVVAVAPFAQVPGGVVMVPLDDGGVLEVLPSPWSAFGGSSPGNEQAVDDG